MKAIVKVKTEDEEKGRLEAPAKAKAEAEEQARLENEGKAKTEEQPKDWLSKCAIVNGETFRNNFMVLPAYSLVMWLMRSSKNFLKIAILKI